MSAPAPALAKAPARRIVVVRLADASEAVAALSLVFAVLLLVFPDSFPKFVVHTSQQGQLMPCMMAIALIFDIYLYLRVSQMLSAKPGIIGAACLGCLPILVVGGLSLVLQAAISHTLAQDLPNLQARIGEEILLHTYLGMVSAIFLPFLVVRLIYQFKAAIF